MPRSRRAIAPRVDFSYASGNEMNMKQHIAVLAVICLGATAYASQPVISPPLVTQVVSPTVQVQPAPAPIAEPAPVMYTYEQHSWTTSAPTHQWEGYVPTGYHPPADNRFDSMPAYSGGYAYSGSCAGGYCAPGLGLSVGFGIGGASVGIGPCGISASVGLGCYPIGVGLGLGCY